MKSFGCANVTEHMSAFLERRLPLDVSRQFKEHVSGCAQCRQSVRQCVAVQGLLQGAVRSGVDKDLTRKTTSWLEAISANALQECAMGQDQDQEDVLEQEPEMAEEQSKLGALAGQFQGAPWWGVSLALHVLLIALAGLVSMSLNMPKTEDAVVMVTELKAAPEITNPMEPEKKSQLKDVLQSDHETPPTDPTSKEASDIVVPPDILAKAELGDHFETINPDRPDTHSAFGNPDAHMFHSVSGSDEPAGGGGMGGASLDDVIGVGGPASPGTGGGWGGGHGTGIGVDTGSGKGSFGNRNGGGRRLMVKRHGGSPATENAVDKALEWLARHQEADGHWDCQKYEGFKDARCQGVFGDGSVTGFALLAFLGAGHTTRVGKYKDNVTRGLDWMMKTLEECEKTNGEGRFGKTNVSNYTQGIATLALAEAAAMIPNNKALKAAAQRAINGVMSGQIKKGPSECEAWDYNPDGQGDDTSVTGWNIMALKSAKVAGLHVDPFSLEGAMRWINAGQDLAGAPPEGSAEYWEGGKMSYRGTVAAPKKGDGSIAVMAAAALTRLMVGGEKCGVPGISGPCNIMKKPENLPANWPGNLYYWYYGTLVMFQKGGEHWNVWNEPMRKTLPAAQRKDGDFAGSWDAYFEAVNGHIYGGRVMSTALGALCLEVYYRFARMR